MQSIECNIVNTLYYLYFERRELVYHFETIWSEDGCRSRHEEYSYIFLGVGQRTFGVELECYYFLVENNIIEEDSGNEYESVYVLTDYYRKNLSIRLNKKCNKNKTKKQ